jgi:phosphatidylglycerol---prolipoprotein diacylglyceryl transferase
VLIGIDPVVVTVGSLAVRWYGLLALVGLGVGVWLTLREATRQHLGHDAVLVALSWAIPVGVLSARLVYVVGWWDSYLTRPADVWRLSLSELSLWGGLAGGLVAAVVALRHDPGLRRRVLDAAAPAAALAIAIGGLGAFVDGHGQGIPTAVPWATMYSSPLASTPDFGVPRHPVQVYEALIALGLFAVVSRLPVAMRAVALLTLMAGARVALGNVHVEPAFVFGFQLEQLLAIVIGAIAVFVGLRHMRHVTRVTMFMKPGCHLCEVALAELETLRRRYPHQLETVDITSDANLLAQFGERVPVVRVGEREYAAPLMRATLERALQSHAS